MLIVILEMIGIAEHRERYDMIQYNIFSPAKKLMGSQLNLLHETKKKQKR